MKFKPHNLILITSSLIFVFAAYLSQKQVENFQPSTPNSKTLVELFNTIKLPAWFTSDRSNKLDSVNKSVNQQDPNIQKLIKDTFDASKAAGDTDDITFDKIMNAQLNYDAKMKETYAVPVSTEVNFTLYFAIGVIVILFISVLIYFLTK
jgi:hypothetical protein